MLLFEGNNCLRHLVTSQVWHVAHGTWMGTISCVYILLPGKTDGMYIERLRGVVNSGLNPTPQSIVIDFEKAAINTARNVLGVNDITDCYFHFCGSVWKRIQKFGLTDNNAQVNLFIGMCIAIAF